MGVGLCCFGPTATTTPRRSRIRGTNSNDRSVSLMSSVIEFMKTFRLGGAQNKNDRKKRSRRPPQPPNKKKRQQQPKVKRVNVLTLKECLSNVDGGGYDDEPMNVFQQFPKKVYSSLDEDESSYFSSSTPISGRFSMETLLKIDQVSSSNPEVDRNSPFTRKQQNGKTEKKVRFTLPGEADIYVYNISPEKEWHLHRSHGFGEADIYV